MIKRSHLEVLSKRITEKRKFIQVVFGPRQVGKTTVVNQLIKASSVPSQYISADATGNLNEVWLEQQWEAARIKLKQTEATEFLLVIDEIQKLPNWSETVKKLWDGDTNTKKNIKVILLGSSRLLL